MLAIKIKGSELSDLDYTTPAGSFHTYKAMEILNEKKLLNHSGSMRTSSKRASVKRKFAQVVDARARFICA